MAADNKESDAKTPDAADNDKRQRDKVDKLLARAPAVSAGSVILANGRQLEYTASATFIPV
ncbi:MAG: hypothetical protein HY021_12750, partial [Burkholderiales bacterium]|nr:hypothetical protein [Burkholderiales bacterium]